MLKSCQKVIFSGCFSYLFCFASSSLAQKTALLGGTLPDWSLSWPAVFISPQMLKSASTNEADDVPRRVMVITSEIDHSSTAGCLNCVQRLDACHWWWLIANYFPFLHWQREKVEIKKKCQFTLPKVPAAFSWDNKQVCFSSLFWSETSFWHFIIVPKTKNAFQALVSDARDLSC